MIWDGLIQSWGHNPEGMSDDEKTLIVASVADRVEEVREAQLVLYLVRSEHMRANALFNEVRADRDVLSEQAAVARSLNSILSSLKGLSVERDSIKAEEQVKGPVDDESEPYSGVTTVSQGDV